MTGRCSSGSRGSSRTPTNLYAFEQGTKTTSLGKFRTALASTKSKTIRFADFNINMGDTVYSDTEVRATGSGLVEFAGTKPVAPPAPTVADNLPKDRPQQAEARGPGART
jgi:hypothetical protein